MSLKKMDAPNSNTLLDGLLEDILPSQALPPGVLQQKLGSFTIEGDLPCPQLFLLPLSTLSIANLYRQEKFASSRLQAILPILKKQHLNILQSRQHEKSGLLYLMDAQESILPTASYWDANHGHLLEPAFIALMNTALENLIFLCGKMGDDPEELIQANELLVHCTNEYLWDEEYGVYFPYAIQSEKLILNNSIGGILPLLADIPDQEQAEAIQRALHYNFVHEAYYRFPLECIETGKENHHTNLLINYLLFQGLKRYEFEGMAQKLADDMLELVDSFGIQVHYNSSKKDAALIADNTNAFLAFLMEEVKKQNLVHYSNL